MIIPCYFQVIVPTRWQDAPIVKLHEAPKDFDFSGRQKWYGSLCVDRYMYCIPNCADYVLRVDLRAKIFTDSSSHIDNNDSFCAKLGEGLGLGGFKWHGGVVGSDSNIYAMPSHAKQILKIITSTGEVKKIGQILEENNDTQASKGRYKYGGGVCGNNGCVYAIPVNISIYIF